MIPRDTWKTQQRLAGGSGPKQTANAQLHQQQELLVVAIQEVNLPQTLYISA
jgi:hypothetical protein